MTLDKPDGSMMKHFVVGALEVTPTVSRKQLLHPLNPRDPVGSARRVVRPARRAGLLDRPGDTRVTKLPPAAR